MIGGPLQCQCRQSGGNRKVDRQTRRLGSQRKLSNEESGSFPGAQLRHALLSFRHALRIRFVRGHFLIQLISPRALLQVLVVKTGGSQPGIELRVAVPLEAASILWHH